MNGRTLKGVSPVADVPGVDRVLYTTDVLWLRLAEAISFGPKCLVGAGGAPAAKRRHTLAQGGCPGSGEENGIESG